MQWQEYKQQLEERVTAKKDKSHPLIDESINAMREGLAMRMGAMIIVNDPAFISITQILERRHR
jgi:hypothetical protein